MLITTPRARKASNPPTQDSLLSPVPVPVAVPVPFCGFLPNVPVQSGSSRMKISAATSGSSWLPLMNATIVRPVNRSTAARKSASIVP